MAAIVYSGVVKRLAILVALLATAHAATAQEAIYVVRHAEQTGQGLVRRDGPAGPPADPPLSTDGIGRSYKLRDLLADAGITHIFTSELRRTVETAAPLAAARHLTPVQAPAADAAALAARLTALGPHDRALVVGHSNTVPALLRALGVDAPIAIADDDYDNLFIVVPQKDGRPVLLRLKY
jgi:broad specificity phosphatase PhoE